MKEQINIHGPLSQSAKAARRSLNTLSLDIHTAGNTSQASGRLLDELSSAEDALGHFASIFNNASSSALGFQLQESLQMVIYNTFEASERYHEAFKKWRAPRESGTTGELRNTLLDIESVILKEKLHLLRIEIDLANENSPLFHSLNAKTMDDRRWNLVSENENAVLSAIIATNEMERAHQLIERESERISCELKSYRIALRYHRKVLDGFISKFHHLRGEQSSGFEGGQSSIFLREITDELQNTVNSMAHSRTEMSDERDSKGYAGISPTLTLVNSFDDLLGSNFVE